MIGNGKLYPYLYTKQNLSGIIVLKQNSHVIILIFLIPYNIVCEALVEIQSNGVTTSGTHFCTKDELVFTCTLLVSGYDWVALPFLDGTPGNGRVSLGTTETVGNFTLSASGTGPTRTSTLQVTAFPGLNGVNVLCRDSGDPGYSQSVNITVFGKTFMDL